MLRIFGTTKKDLFLEALNTHHKVSFWGFFQATKNERKGGREEVKMRGRGEGGEVKMKERGEGGKQK